MILSAHLCALRNCVGSVVPKSINEDAISIVEATCSSLLVSIDNATLLPTPFKSYALLTLRDVTKLMQGLVLGAQSCSLEALSLDLL